MNQLKLSVAVSFYGILPALMILAGVALFLRAGQIAAGKRQDESAVKRNRQITGLVLALLLIYMVTYICLTFVFRRTVTAQPRAKLQPFWSYRAAFQSNFRIRRLGLVRDIVLNILLTVPLGLLLPLLFHKKKHPYLLTAILTVSLTLLTESLQYITHLGWFETDDLINNTLGCFLGLLVISSGTVILRKVLTGHAFRRQESHPEEAL